MKISVFVCANADCPPDRLWLARIERGTTATTVFAPTQADVRVKAEAAVAAEQERARRAGRPA
ncbi:hypothetical protein [Methylobacterium isbiliense]|uniref:Uncharacterized protein n=1 Tax=Methylobacterium isbiliense TaxID=315478 RepID=A0ABQ4SIA0_9HYPH|nr:hypothetical protein [Methylobacterium isbiliense]MDN3622556.1 hypothetical protein [Methylobacterium isbiliense]GJE01460.1 hypothetical protein GMJLKIPL_3391 [Methylobacterium isbiliense]